MACVAIGCKRTENSQRMSFHRMANRRPQMGGRRNDFVRNDRKNFGRSGVSPWQGGGPGNGGMPNIMPLPGGSTEATLALASNIINLLQPRQNPVPSLLDMPIRRDFGPDLGRFDRGFGPNRMGNQCNFRRTGNYNRAGERINNRKPFRPNEGYRQQNKNVPKKEADSKAKPVKESDQEAPAETVVKAEPEEEKKDTPKTRYDDVNPQHLRCHICNKSMWDGRSFENHLSGRAHAIMMQKTAESYALAADTMRQEFKIREMKRTRKAGAAPTRDFYCAMCDLYAADGALHRTTVGHRKLKKFLHPSCTCCHKEMPTRIELDEHRLTAEHLRNMQDKQDLVSKPKPEVMLISTLSMEQSYLREDRQRRPRDRRNENDNKEDTAIKEEKLDSSEAMDESAVSENETSAEGEAAAPTEGDGTEVKQKEEGFKDPEGVILDYKEGDDLSTITKDQIPVYSTERGVGASFLSEFRCVQCKLCRKLLDSEETAAVHLRTWRHHLLYSRLLHDAANKNQGAAEGAAEASKRALENDDESGNWKRRRTAVDNNTENGDLAEHVKEEVNSEVEAEEEAEGATDLPEADDLEDWEQSVDDILNDEAESRKEPEVEKPVEETEPEKTPEVEKPKPSPTRGRGRGRGRKRY